MNLIEQIGLFFLLLTWSDNTEKHHFRSAGLAKQGNCRNEALHCGLDILYVVLAENDILSAFSISLFLKSLENTLGTFKYINQ